MSRHPRGRSRRIVGLALVAALAGCQVGPRAPLMSPLEAGGDYGHSDRQLSERRYEVSYLGPSVRTSLAPANREEDAEVARGLAYDLALWRAAELALENGFAAFAVEDSRADVDVEVIEDGPYFSRVDAIPTYDFQGTGFHRIQPRIPRLRSAWLRARVTLTVVLHAAPSDDALDAAQTVERLKDKHPGALAPP